MTIITLHARCQWLLRASQFVSDNNSGFICGLASRLPPELTVHFRQPHRNKLNKFKSGDREGQAKLARFTSA
jgi:hypothetical protein